jgi:hypothetical protein
MRNAIQSPCLDITFAIVLIAAGVLLFINRRGIGAFTGYYVGRGGRVDKPTPGWMLIPFALVLIFAGAQILWRYL